MAKSEITNCLVKIDIFDYGDLFALKPNEKLIFLYCLLQGAKNNLGIFKMHRGRISMWLGIPIEEVHAFFDNHKDLVEFDENSHGIWVKPFFDLVDFGLTKPLHKRIYKKEGKKKEGKQPRELIEVIDTNSRNNKNNFVSKVNAGFREEPYLQIFAQSWVRHNFIFLSRINEELKNITNNKHSLDKVLQSY